MGPGYFQDCDQDSIFSVNISARDESLVSRRESLTTGP